MNQPGDTPTRMSIAEADARLTAPGQMFEIDEVDIRGVRTKVWKNCPPTLADILRLSRVHGDKVFLVYEDDQITFIAMRNYPEWSVAFWAATSAGAVAVPLNSWWTGNELEFGLADSGAKVVFADGARAARIAPHRGSLPDLATMIVTRPEGRLPEGALEWAAVTGARAGEGGGAQAAGSGPGGGAGVIGQDDLPRVGLGPDDDATIFYTSGTTGHPKGALGTHRNICTSPLSLYYVNSRASLRAGEEPTLPGSGGQNAYLLSVPLFHATGCHSILVGNILAGGKLVMMYRWDAGRALELIERERITSFGGVPTMVLQVLDHPDFPRRDTSSVRSVGFGGAPAPPELAARIKEQFHSSPASNGYGLTETSAISTMNSGADYLAKPDSVGPPVPVVSLKVVDGEDGELPTGEVGELWIKGPNVVKGYWGQPEATASVFTDGWLHTGDVARLDEEGFLYIVDRAKDVLIRGGENIYCVEIEGILYEHSAVADVAVIGVPHPTLGEEVGAVVTLLPGRSATVAELQEFVAARLAAFKVPVHIWFYDRELPRNPAGKLLKRELRDELVAG
jgi:long-chain acyl-CoA synthetase